MLNDQPVYSEQKLAGLLPKQPKTARSRGGLLHTHWRKEEKLYRAQLEERVAKRPRTEGTAAESEEVVKPGQTRAEEVEQLEIAQGVPNE